LNLLENIKQITFLTGFEFKKLTRQKQALVGICVILLLTLLFFLGFYLRRNQVAQHNFQGQLMKELLNGIAFSESILVPAIYFMFPMVVGIFSAGTFAGEFQLGLIRTVSIRPIPRWCIFISKFIAMGIYAYILLTVQLVVSYILGGIIFGFSGDVYIWGPGFFGKGASIYIFKESVAWQRLFLSYFFAGYALISISAMFLMFSAIFKKMTTATVVALGVYFSSYIIGILPFMENIRRFLPSRYLMIWKYTMAQEIMWDAMINDGIFLGAYTLAYCLIGIFVFNSTDI